MAKAKQADAKTGRTGRNRQSDRYADMDEATLRDHAIVRGVDASGDLDEVRERLRAADRNQPGGATQAGEDS